MDCFTCSLENLSLRDMKYTAFDWQLVLFVLLYQYNLINNIEVICLPRFFHFLYNAIFHMDRLLT